MRRIWTLAYKDIYITFTDRSGLLIMLAAPFALALIIAFAFGGLGGNTIRISAIPVAVVNQDTGVELNGQTVQYGAIFTQVFVPDADVTTTTNPTACATANPTPNDPSSLDELLAGVPLDDAAAARAGVEQGDYAAAIIIPADFSRQLAPQITATEATLGTTQLEIYTSPASNISASIVRSIAQSVTNQIVTGNVTIAATLGELISRAQTNPGFGLRFLAAQTAGTFQPDFSCAFSSALHNITIQREPLNAAQQQSTFVQLLVTTGSGLAVFFALFTAQNSLLSIYQEQQQGTLPRLLVTPMPPSYILLGKLLATFLNALLQIVVLLVALTVVASVIEGQPMFIWGNPVLVLVVVIILTLSVAGLAVIVVGIARTPEQARMIGSILNAGLGALGGTFGFALPEAVARFSPIYWGSDAFRHLSAGSSDIALNLLILILQGGVMFIIGTWLFNRRVGLR